MVLEKEWKQKTEEKLSLTKEKKIKIKYLNKYYNNKNKIHNNIKINKYKFILIKYINNNKKNPRIGILIKKKYIKLSTTRNKLRRIIKETFRINQYKIKKLDYLIIIKKNIYLLKKKYLFNYFIKIWKKYYI